MNRSIYIALPLFVWCLAILPVAAGAQTSALSRAVRTSETMEPAVPQPEQEEAVAGKLTTLHEKTGKRPNILWLVVDDMGYGDPGVYGGGAAIARPPRTSTAWPARGSSSPPLTPSPPVPQPDRP